MLFVRVLHETPFNTQLFLVKRSAILSEVAFIANGSRETTLVGDLSESWPPV